MSKSNDSKAPTSLLDLLNQSNVGLDGMKGSLAEAFAKVNEAKKTKAVEAMVSLLQEAMTANSQDLTHLRYIRRQERIYLSKIKKMSQAIVHLQATGNPFPLLKTFEDGGRPSDRISIFCHNAGVPVPDANAPIWKISKSVPTDQDFEGPETDSE